MRRFRQDRLSGRTLVGVLMTARRLSGGMLCSPVTTFLPLILVLGISMVKEALEDFSRYRQDRWPP